MDPASPAASNIKAFSTPTVRIFLFGKEYYYYFISQNFFIEKSLEIKIQLSLKRSKTKSRVK